MHFLLAAMIAFLGLASRGWLFQPVGGVIAVSNLQPGTTLQGVFTLQGTVQADQFSRYEVSFAYTGDSTGAWFLIGQGSQPVQDGVLIGWDTTLITDGDYRLRIRVITTIGLEEERIVEDISVRNDTPVEALSATAGKQETATILPPTLAEPAAPTVHLESTLPPSNPVSFSRQDFRRVILSGAGLSVLAFILFGMYLSATERLRRR